MCLLAAIANAIVIRQVNIKNKLSLNWHEFANLFSVSWLKFDGIDIPYVLLI
jgi:hypothetical protein